jgi:hypothetical protein
MVELGFAGPETGGGDAIGTEAVGAGPLRVAVVLSGARCLLTYVVGPALAPVGFAATLVGPIAVWLHLLALGSVGYGTARMWRGRRRGRVAYTAFAIFVAVLSLAGVTRALA